MNQAKKSVMGVAEESSHLSSAMVMVNGEDFLTPRLRLPTNGATAVLVAM